MSNFNIYSIQKMDELVINTFYNNNKLIVQRFRSSYINSHSEIFSYLKTRYSDSTSYQETVYRIKNGIDIRPVCEQCGNPVMFYQGKFTRFCSVSCSRNNKQTQEKYKQTSFKNYGVENPSQSKDIRDKIKENNIKKYGVENTTQLDSVKEKMKSTNLEKYGVENPGANKDIIEKRNKTILERYGVNNVFASAEIQDKIKQHNLEKYGVEYTAQVKSIKEKIQKTNNDRYGGNAPICSDKVKSKFNFAEIQKKALETKRKRKTFNTSKPEEDAYLLLKELYPDVIRQYKSDLYPFACDFYIPGEDLYIELNAHWTHGGHKYNQDDPKDVKLVEYWKNKNTKFYNIAIDIWTIRDPLKRKIAKNNNLNFIECWSFEELDFYIKNKRGS